jgi:hypothetical protein
MAPIFGSLYQALRSAGVDDQTARKVSPWSRHRFRVIWQM